MNHTFARNDNRIFFFFSSIRRVFIIPWCFQASSSSCCSWIINASCQLTIHVWLSESRSVANTQNDKPLLYRLKAQKAFAVNCENYSDEMLSPQFSYDWTFLLFWLTTIMYRMCRKKPELSMYVLTSELIILIFTSKYFLTMNNRSAFVNWGIAILPSKHASSMTTVNFGTTWDFKSHIFGAYKNVPLFRILPRRISLFYPYFFYSACIWNATIRTEVKSPLQISTSLPV